MPQPEIQLFGAHEVATLEDELAVASARLIAAQQDLGQAVDLLNGLCGLVQLVQRQLPGFDRNHRYVDAMAWLEAHAKGERHVDQA